MLPVTIAEPEAAVAAPTAQTALDRKRRDGTHPSGTIEIERNGMRMVVRGTMDAQILQMVLTALTYG